MPTVPTLGRVWAAYVADDAGHADVAVAVAALGLDGPSPLSEACPDPDRLAAPASPPGSPARGNPQPSRIP
ncbi:hypothetical protein C8E95_5631 [Pseudonocardia autotrophica]|uniref:Uncharacterized protein n=2 Tax=Pseudonocardia TaxID=1847 RepID=A0A1Y2MJL9_PSEAH|nr:hypothetical protein BG845_06648 [Pseudonocardia autotrophica]TDN76428.1 hypothetical protein C8E95_5631 [Pseudonocardia autotrophica]BBG00423.1 hypothetical protein Pdca_16320 [Pseudonocardia autotrophica]GEC29765.1 hypothetical protein PSA01_67940 [Pseudonocardia saturnea]